MIDPVLTVSSLGVQFGSDVVLSDVSFDLPRRGMTVLVGPGGAGKSTLLRTLAGANDRHPSLRTTGRVELAGVHLHYPARGDEHVARPSLVLQHARFFLDTLRENLVSALPNRSALTRAEQSQRIAFRLHQCGLSELCDQLDREAVSLPLSLQRRLSIARCVMAEPAVLMADEVTAGLEDAEAAKVLSLLRSQSEVRSVVYVTHNQRLAREAGGITMLLAEGTLREISPTRQFFYEAKTELGRAFVRTGGCVVPRPARRSSDKRGATVARTRDNRAAKSHTLGPRGFFWVQPGRLGGTPRPGIIDKLEHDLLGLQRLGINKLVSLEEEPTVDSSALRAVGIEGLHFPVVDMNVPSLERAGELCATVADWQREGAVTALHCRAGLGRTGTLLACQLIWEGASARDALDSVRNINPRCVQSDVQVQFLRAFESFARSTDARSGELVRIVS